MLTRTDLQSIEKLVRTVVKEVAVTKEDAKTFTTKDDLNRMEKRLDKKFTDIFNFLDKDVMENQRRLKRVENSLDLPPLQ